MQKIKIIYEDDDILVVNKPAGLLVHGGKNTKGETLVNWILEKYPEIKGVGDSSLEFGKPLPEEDRSGIVHRLDRDTSGVLLVAKTQTVFGFLKEQFQGHEIEKKYIALVCGTIKESAGIIDCQIGKSKIDFRKKACLPREVFVKNVKGSVIGTMKNRKVSGFAREAVTRYRVVEKFIDIHGSISGVDNCGSFALVEVFPETGRTHQIRVHFEYIGHPIVGDVLYGHLKDKQLFGLKRHFLHAQKITFTHPNGKKMNFEVELPEELKNVLEKLKSKIKK